jgi:hypothetical protein
MEFDVIVPGTGIGDRICENRIIYGLCDPCDLSMAVRYVGYTAYPQERLAQHSSAAEDYNPGLQRWLKGLRMAGLSPQMIVLEYTDHLRWARAERHWIKRLRSSKWGSLLLNIEDGGISKRYMKIASKQPKNRRKKQVNVAREARKNAKKAARMARKMSEITLGGPKWFPTTRLSFGPCPDE